MSFMDQLVTAGIFIVLLLMIIFNKTAVESLINNFECNSNMQISDTYKSFIRYLYIATLTVLSLYLLYGRLLG